MQKCLKHIYFEKIFYLTQISFKEQLSTTLESSKVSLKVVLV